MMSRVNAVLSEFLPARYRDEIVGDLIEQSLSARQMMIELIVTIAALLPMQFSGSEDDKMKHAKWIAAAAILVLGALQAWDSGILNAPLIIGAMVVFAIAIGIIALFIENEMIRLTLAAIVMALLFAARIMSPVRLPELTLVGIPILVILVFGPRFMALAKEKNPPRGPGTAV